MILPFTEQTSTRRWPQWWTIEDSLIQLGLAEKGRRLKSDGFPLTPIAVKGFGYGVFACEPSQPIARGRGSPHRLKVMCSCGRMVFFGRLGQHYGRALCRTPYVSPTAVPPTAKEGQ
jgi:hypothetical protein